MGDCGSGDAGSGDCGSGDADSSSSSVMVSAAGGTVAPADRGLGSAVRPSARSRVAGAPVFRLPGEGGGQRVTSRSVALSTERKINLTEL